MQTKEIQHYVWDKDINFTCPLCTYTFHIPFRTYINEGVLVHCPCCCKQIEIQHSGSIKHFISEILSHKILL